MKKAVREMTGVVQTEDKEIIIDYMALRLPTFTSNN